MEINAECGSCGQHYSVDHAYIGEQIVCPNCNQQTTVRPITPKSAAVPAKEVQTNVKRGAVIVGWVCFGVAAVVLFIPFPTWFLYTPLFFVSFVLGIVALAQGRIASGITLLLANIIGTPVLFIAALVLGLVTWRAVGAALHQASVQSQNAAISNAFSQAASTVFSNQLSKNDQAANGPSSAASPSVDKIEGAFGQKLGGEFNPSFAIGSSQLSDGTPMYEYNEKSTFRSFDHYYVLITPATHKIYSILATANFDSELMAEKEQTVVMEMLAQKYGPVAGQGPSDKTDHFEKIEQGKRDAGTKITGLTDVTLYILYYDDDLASLAEKERIANEVQHSDKTGI